MPGNAEVKDTPKEELLLADWPGSELTEGCSCFPVPPAIP